MRSVLLGWTAVLALVAATLAAPAAATPAGVPRSAEPSTYTNPIMSEFADAFSDPAVIRAKDGYWYAYATTTVMTRENDGAPFEDQHFMPMARSADLHTWEYVGDVFGPDHYPDWVTFRGTYYWAPDVRYIDGRYYLYYSIAGNGRNAIGVATSDSPSGPWEDSGGPVVDRDGGVNEIDPAVFVDDDGTKYLYYGSFQAGGIQAVRLSEDGTRAVGPNVQVVSESRGEAAWVVKRDGYYYLFYSGLGCCAKAEGSYPVFVGRSTSPLGPFLDAEGVSLTAPHPGGTIVNAPNGNGLIGTGHNAIAVDKSGQDWIFVNSFDRFDTWGGRPTAMDRLDWIDGWPTVRAGRWSSDTPQTPPVGSWDFGSHFTDGDLDGWEHLGGRWTIATDAQSGEHVAVRTKGPRPSILLGRSAGPRDYRAEADLRVTDSKGAAGLVVAYRDRENHAVAWLDAGQRALVVDVVEHGRVVRSERSPLYAGFRYDTWHAVTAQVRGAEATFEVSPAMEGDPLATVTVRLPRRLTGDSPVGVAARAGGAHADNVGITRLYEPVTEKVPDPKVGRLLPAYSDEFDDGHLDDAWSWIGEPDGDERDGAYVWDTQDADLSGTGTHASVLLRDAPDGDYTVETKLHFPLGVDYARKNEQAGLIAWIDREDSIHLAPTPVGTSRQVLLWIGRDRDPWPEMQLGPSADTLWLRLRHTRHPDTGEHLFRAATSRDGETWIWGGVWHLPGDAEPPRIGLVSMGGEGATATFEYVRFYDR